MARQLKLVRLDDFIADIDSVDLFAGGYSLAEDGYTPTVAPLGASSVHEVITLKLQGTSKDDLASLTQDIDEKIKQVQWWIDDPGIERYQVWLRVQQDGETYPRQAQILNILPPDKVRIFQPEEINQNYIGEYSIGIERTPFWEDPYSYPSTTAVTDILTLGGMGSLSETIRGDVPARLAEFNFTASGSSINLAAWFGFKSNRFGTAANFVPTWALDLSNTKSADMSTFADSSAYDGNHVTCTFASGETLINRLIISVNDVAAAHPEDQRGSYLVLLRAKMAAAGTTRVRMSYSNSTAGITYNPVYRSRQVITSTDWALYEMGNISIPPTIITPSDTIKNFSIGIDAERLAGLNALQFDCLVLIPLEGMIKVSTAHIWSDATSQNVHIYTKADGRIVAYDKIKGDFSLVYANQPVNWSLPANGDSPKLIYCGQHYTDGGTVKTYKVNVGYTYIPRWRTLRGSST